MSPALTRLADRIDALSLRERVFLFLSLAVLLMALADQAVISSSLRQQAAWNSQVTTEAAALGLLRQELQQLQSGAGPDLKPGDSHSTTGKLMQELGDTSQARDQLRSQLEAAHGPAVRPAELSDLMTRVLQRHQGVSLVQMATQAPQALAAGPAQAAQSATEPGWRSVWLSVSGPYAELQGFIAALETALPGLRWGSLQLRTDGPQPLLSVQVWLMGTTP
jgi:MSHA biogenesis protein MshJ